MTQSSTFLALKTSSDRRHLVPVPSDVEEALAGAASRLGPMARHLVWFSEVPSTNDVAVRLAEAGEAEGVVVVADAQSRGRGRHGRSWASPAGAGLYASIVLRPPTRAVPLLTLAAGLAVSDGIRAASGLQTCLKWPNDVHAVRTVVGADAEASTAANTAVGVRTRDGARTATGAGAGAVTGRGLGAGRKIAGILAEAGGSSPVVQHVGQHVAQHVVLGVGINVTPGAYPSDVAARATSLESELGRGVDRGLVLAECLAALWARYSELRDGQGHAVLNAWRERARPTLGRVVEWGAGLDARRGTAQDVDEGGALLVETADGIETIRAGEVRWTL